MVDSTSWSSGESRAAVLAIDDRSAAWPTTPDPSSSTIPRPVECTRPSRSQPCNVRAAWLWLPPHCSARTATRAGSGRSPSTSSASRFSSSRSSGRRSTTTPVGVAGRVSAPSTSTTLVAVAGSRAAWSSSSSTCRTCRSGASVDSRPTPPVTEQAATSRAPAVAQTSVSRSRRAPAVSPTRCTVSGAPVRLAPCSSVNSQSLSRRRGTGPQGGGPPLPASSSRCSSCVAGDGSTPSSSASTRRQRSNSRSARSTAPR